MGRSIGLSNKKRTEKEDKIMDLTTLHVQRELKPKIEDVIPLSVDKKYQAVALEFIAWLRENKMSPAWSGVHNSWDSKCKGSTICKISLGEKFTITPYLTKIFEYEHLIICEHLENFVLDNIIYCCHADKYERPKDSPPVKHIGLSYPCNGWNCAPGKDIVICGKEIKNKCCNSNRRFYWFENPDTVEIEAVKKLIVFEQRARK